MPERGCGRSRGRADRSADTLLVNPAHVEKGQLPGMKFIDVDPSEPHAANALLVGETVICQPAFPKTCRRLEEQGIRVVLVDESELAKAEGGLTCCSLIFTTRSSPRPGRDPAE